jgi:hypothetical protein
VRAGKAYERELCTRQRKSGAVLWRRENRVEIVEGLRIPAVSASAALSWVPQQATDFTVFGLRPSYGYAVYLRSVRFLSLNDIEELFEPLTWNLACVRLFERHLVDAEELGLDTSRYAEALRLLCEHMLERVERFGTRWPSVAAARTTRRLVEACFADQSPAERGAEDVLANGMGAQLRGALEGLLRCDPYRTSGLRWEVVAPTPAYLFLLRARRLGLDSSDARAYEQTAALLLHELAELGREVQLPR